MYRFKTDLQRLYLNIQFSIIVFYLPFALISVVVPVTVVGLVVVGAVVAFVDVVFVEVIVADHGFVVDLSVVCSVVPDYYCLVLHCCSPAFAVVSSDPVIVQEGQMAVSLDCAGIFSPVGL